jgi:transposase
MKTSVVGIDISKDHLDVSICHLDSLEPIRSFQITNDVKGIGRLIQRCNKISKDLWFCFEHTGNYGLLLACFLQNHSIPFSAVSPLHIKRSLGMTRGKNDQIDAVRIAQYAVTYFKQLEPSFLPSDKMLKIKHLLTFRKQLVKTSSQLQNSIKSLKVSMQSLDVSDIISTMQRQLSDTKQLIKQQEEKILHIIEQDETLSLNYHKIIRVKGIGPVIAAYLLVLTNNFKAFDSPRKFNCFSGLAPFEHRSGSSIRGKTRTSHLRNKTIKSLLFNGANSAATHDHQLKKYYQRKKEEGKHHNSIINAIACKLIYRVFAVVKRNEPFVEFSF